MAATSSTMLELGTVAPAFTLPDPDGTLHSTSDYAAAPALLVMFICNHCPFVKHVRAELARLGHDYRSRGVAILAVNSNDAQQYPADGPNEMRAEKEAAGYPFPYLYDEAQAVAASYKAACTPDFYLFDGQRKLVYRGQLDDSRPSNGIPVTGTHLRGALDAVLAGRPISAVQIPSIGCSIKWRPGHQP
ncbi:MAG: thioredoxin family protein [Longimicrobiales bacterium]